jgi:hypothetical protein
MLRSSSDDIYSIHLKTLQNVLEYLFFRISVECFMLVRREPTGDGRGVDNSPWIATESFCVVLHSSIAVTGLDDNALIRCFQKRPIRRNSGFEVSNSRGA